MTHDLPNIRQAASLWRKRHPDQAHCSIVVTLSHAGMHAATGSTLTPIASNFPPGTYIVNPDASLQVASGGRLYSAEEWETLEPADRASAYRMTRGPVCEERTGQYHALRNLIKQEADVHSVLELQFIGRPDRDVWLYLVQCPLHWIFPKFVIGLTQSDNSDPQVIFRCGAEWSAREEWHRRTLGGNLTPSPDEKG